jgi:hypothetical protein
MKQRLWKGYKRFWLWSFILGSLVFLIQFAFTAPQSLIRDWLMGIPLIFIVGPTFLALIDGVLVLTNRAYDSAMTAAQPIPSPQEIYAGLANEWGRAPTVQEVAAVQQVLVNQRNQHLINAGMSFGVLYMVHDASRRSRGM